MKIKSWQDVYIAMAAVGFIASIVFKIIFDLYRDFGVGINMPICVVIAFLATGTVFVCSAAATAKNPSGFQLAVKKNLWLIIGWTVFYVMSPLILRAVNLHEARYAFLVAILLVFGVDLVRRVFHPGNISATKFGPDDDQPTAVKEPRRELGLEMLDSRDP